ncbi:hypothetical protein [Marinilactibacillus kalidii]|uniref:hypothetical protein n=1 Tax=Marinilactibacillus kalidii TaxID=2820274 RepID=UPI001ABDC246|nr:hypothetical protein [Marinilactibacillus kalidii]
MALNEIEFYKGKDEERFLQEWEAQNGSLSDDAQDKLYTEIGDEIARQLKTGEHELGKLFVYKGVEVGKSDYNQFYELYLFDEK